MKSQNREMRAGTDIGLGTNVRRGRFYTQHDGMVFLDLCFSSCFPFLSATSGRQALASYLQYHFHHLGMLQDWRGLLEWALNEGLTFLHFCWAEL